MGWHIDGGLRFNQIFYGVIRMIISSLLGAVALFLKFGPYIVGLKICTSAVDIATTYAKNKITKGDAK